jgi:hypothetical protein
VLNNVEFKYIEEKPCIFFKQGWKSITIFSKISKNLEHEIFYCENPYSRLLKGKKHYTPQKL